MPVEQAWVAMTQGVAIHIAALQTSTLQPAFPDFRLDGSGRWMGLPTIVTGAAFGAASQS